MLAVAFNKFALVMYKCGLPRKKSDYTKDDKLCYHVLVSYIGLG